MKSTIERDLRRATTFARQGRTAEATRIFRGILQRHPTNQRALKGLSDLSSKVSPTLPQHESAALIVLYDERRFQEVIDRASDLCVRYTSASFLYTIQGAAHAEFGSLERALACYEMALTLNPNSADAHNNRGLVLRRQRSLDQALAAYDMALSISPQLANVHINRGNILRELNRLDEAVASYDEALRLAPDRAEAYVGRGDTLMQLSRFTGALASYDNALRLRFRSADLYSARGYALSVLKRLDDALASYDAAIQLRPNDADIHVNRGNALVQSKRLDEAIAAYATALSIEPHHDAALGLMLHQKAKICDWSSPPQTVDLTTLGIGRCGISPFAMLSLDDNPARQLARAQTWCEQRLPASFPMLATPSPRPARLRIGYFSADYHDHAAMHLMARLFELHDRRRFELHAFSYGIEKRDAMRLRVSAAIEHFHDVERLSNEAIADFACSKGIDIAVDLSGYTREDRAGIFAHRAAPVQINYLGYPGTMGADCFDYLIADRVVVPPQAREFFSEKIIQLPHCYQANDDRRPISNREFTRSELGLPEQAFVFCSFNNNYKIPPAEFGIWMRLLGKVPGSVLWLLEANRWTKANLSREALARGIDPTRLVFAARMPNPDHLARHRHADLFLDTFNYNAHTTACDALWCGLPIVTKIGQSFAARVAASLLHTIGLTELVTTSAAEYESLALMLATDSSCLATLKAKLEVHRLKTRLFDSACFARNLERAYDLAYARRAAGLAADHIEVDEIEPGSITLA